MNSNLIRSYLKRMPAVICTAGSYIAAKNSEADEQLDWLVKGANLFDYMSPELVLKYESNFLSAADGKIFAFTINGPDREWYAIATFDSVCTRRFSGVFFFSEKGNAESFAGAVPCIATMEEKIAMASVLLEISDKHFYPVDKTGLTDIRSSTLAVMKKLEISKIYASFSENPAMKKAYYVPVDIPMTNYLQMAYLMILAADEISEGCGIAVKLCKYGDVSELRVTASLKTSLYSYSSVDELMIKFGEAVPFVSVCRYVAGVSECIFDVKFDENSVTFVLSLNEKKYIDVDFKSRNALLYFEESYSFVECFATLLKSGNTKKQSENKDSIYPGL